MTTVHLLPWMRLGLAATVTGGADGTARFQPEVTVKADDDRQTVPGPEFRLRGPGDVLALNPAEIKRRDPEPGSAGAETNFFCSIEFHAPDLPWRFSPLAVDGDGNLPPWLALVVVELGAEAELRTPTGRLPVLEVERPGDHLPPLDDAWAWAHVQAATEVSADPAADYERDPAAFTSRVMCPRRLAANTRYAACLVPVFDAGRMAGLGLTPPASTDWAWSTGPVELPVYDSWELTAGRRADFASLAKRIDPVELPSGVGVRDLDLSDPGIGLPSMDRPASFYGAMHAPSDGRRYWSDADDRQTFAGAIRLRLPTADRPRHPDRPSGYDPLVDDPVVHPPVHGAPQVGTDIVPDDPKQPGWFEALNLGPEHRAVAGIGAEVVRHDQEALMAAAWEQAQAAIEVNRTLNRGRLVAEAAEMAQSRFDRLNDADRVAIAGPALRSMRSDGTTVRRLVVDGDAPTVYFDATFRRLGRPGGPLSVRTDTTAGRSPADAIVAAAVRSAAAGPDPASPLSTGYRIRYRPAGMDTDTATRSWDRYLPAASLAPAAQTTARNYALPAPDHDVTIDDLLINDEAYQFARPADDGRIVTSGDDPGHLGADVAQLVTEAVDAPGAVRSAVISRVVAPAGLLDAALPLPTSLDLQPQFTDPMYERVRALSVDYLVPGVGDVTNNVAGLLEINPAYVEAFLVGLNHEMSREFRWREYPAALNRTWFQHFWDNVDPQVVDIEPIDGWPVETPLGHWTSTSASLVLLLKADLVRRFPDVRVYAVAAEWVGDERVPVDDEELMEPPTLVGTLGRGVNFYGFNGLTEEKARGDTGERDGAGWFFVMEEEPRSTRFGLNVGNPGQRGNTPGSWANASWQHLSGDRDLPPPIFATIDSSLTDHDPGGLRWGDDAAVMGAITVRRPIQVFLHATAMLPDA